MRIIISVVKGKPSFSRQKFLFYFSNSLLSLYGCASANTYSSSPRYTHLHHGTYFLNRTLKEMAKTHRSFQVVREQLERLDCITASQNQQRVRRNKRTFPEGQTKGGGERRRSRRGKVAAMRAVDVEQNENRGDR